MSNGHGPTSSPSNASATTIKPTDLRGILQYVPRFQGQIFVIAIDGSIVADENFANLIVDIAVLRSLGIKIVLVHGIGHQLRELSVMREIPLSNVDGSGVTDAATLDLAIRASSRVAHELGHGASSVTRMADRLEATGHVVRGHDPANRSIVTLGLTAAGKRLVDQVLDWRRAELTRLLGGLDPDERATLASSMRRLHQAVGEQYATDVHGPVPL